MNQRPPHWPSRLLAKLCSEEQLEILYGDVHEVFYQRVRKQGIWKAKLFFYRDVFSLIRPFALKRVEEYHPSLNLLNMIGIHLKTSARSLKKNGLSTFINVFGLTVGLAAVLLIAQYAMFELSYDKFHKNSERIYRASFVRAIDNEEVMNAATIFMPIGPELVKNYPEVINQSRFYYPFTHGEIKYQDQTFNEEKPVFAEPSYFQMFSFRLEEGDVATALSEPNKVVITRLLANRYFGDEPAIGKIIEFSFEDGKTKLEVSGVLEGVRTNSHLRMNMLISFKTLDQWPIFKENEWSLPFYHTYLEFNEATVTTAFEEKSSALLRGFRPIDDGRNVMETIELQALEDIHLDSDLTFELYENGDRQSVNFMIVIAGLILFIAYLNYVNLTTAKSVKRAKEVGLRKIMGSRKGQLVGQFLTESFLLNFISLVIAVGLTYLMVPYFSGLLEKEFAVTGNIGFWSIVLLSVGLGGFISGLYPAFVISSYQPISVLKGSFSTSSKGTALRKVLVTFQFLISVLMVGGTMLLLGQTDFLMNKNLGFDADQIMVINAPRVEQKSGEYLSAVRAFGDAVTNMPNVNSFTHSGSVPGKALGSGSIQNKQDVSGQSISIQLNTIDFGFFDTYGINFEGGEGFGKDRSTDQDAIVINEAALKALRFDDIESALNGKVLALGREFRILGVVKDYHHSSIKRAVEPIAFIFSPQRTIYFSLHINTDRIAETIASIESLMLERFPESPFEYHFLDQAFNAEFKSELRFARVFKSFSVLAIVLGGLGLFGLASFVASQKIKEISVRKVLGASIVDILKLLASKFLWSLIIGGVLAWIILYVGGRAWLDGYAFRIDLQWQHFVIPILMVSGLSVLTIGYRTIMAARTEPTKNLRNE